MTQAFQNSKLESDVSFSRKSMRSFGRIIESSVHGGWRQSIGPRIQMVVKHFDQNQPESTLFRFGTFQNIKICQDLSRYRNQALLHWRPPLKCPSWWSGWLTSYHQISRSLLHVLVVVGCWIWCCCALGFGRLVVKWEVVDCELVRFETIMVQSPEEDYTWNRHRRDLFCPLSVGTKYLL